MTAEMSMFADANSVTPVLHDKTRLPLEVVLVSAHTRTSTNTKRATGDSRQTKVFMLQACLRSFREDAGDGVLAPDNQPDRRVVRPEPAASMMF